MPSLSAPTYLIAFCNLSFTFQHHYLPFLLLPCLRRILRHAPPPPTPLFTFLTIPLPPTHTPPCSAALRRFSAIISFGVTIGPAEYLQRFCAAFGIMYPTHTQFPLCVFGLYLIVSLSYPHHSRSVSLATIWYVSILAR
jgi:hypothetical protein